MGWKFSLAVASLSLGLAVPTQAEPTIDDLFKASKKLCEEKDPGCVKFTPSKDGVTLLQYVQYLDDTMSARTTLNGTIQSNPGWEGNIDGSFVFEKGRSYTFVTSGRISDPTAPVFSDPFEQSDTRCRARNELNLNISCMALLKNPFNGQLKTIGWLADEVNSTVERIIRLNGWDSSEIGPDTVIPIKLQFAFSGVVPEK